MSQVTSSRVLKGTLIATALAAAVLFYMVRQLPEGTSFLEAVGRLNLGAGLVALCLLMVSYVADAMRLWWLLKATRNRVSFSTALQTSLGANFVSFVTPFMSGGLPTMVFMLASRGLPVAQVSTAVVALTLVSHIVIGVLSLALPVAAFLTSSYDAFSALLVQMSLAVVPLNLAGIVVMIVSASKADLVHNVLHRVEFRLAKAKNRFSRSAAQGMRNASDEVDLFHTSFHQLVSSEKIALLKAAGWSLVYSMAFYTLGYSLFLGLGVDPGFFRTTGAEILVSMLSIASPTPGGSGTAEMGTYAFFARIAPIDVVMVYTLAWRILTYWLGIIFGAAAFGLFLNRLRRKPD